MFGLGSSPKTSFVGWVIIIGDVIKLIGDTIEAQGLPTGLSGWIGFGMALATGLGLIMSKDYDVSNSENPKHVGEAVK